MESMKLYREWCERLAGDTEASAELAALEGNEAEIHDRFYRNLSFGTGGIRDVIGMGTNRMNRYTVRKATLGFAHYLKKHFGDAACTRGVVIAHDNRRMSREFCMETAGVLAAEGIRAFLFDALRPTPMLSFAVREVGAVGGVMITASHNPPEYNGYKVYDEHGCQLVPHLSDALTEQISAIDDPLGVTSLTPEAAGDLMTVLPASLDEKYYRAVLGIRLQPAASDVGLSVVYSPQHGTGNVPVREVLSRAGYRVIPVVEQCPPDPEFSATPNPNPEVAAAFDLSLAYAKREGADIAITTDPDCDRLGVAVKAGDDYVLLSGNQSGALLLEYILSVRSKEGTLAADAVMFNTVVTSTLGDAVAKKWGVRVEKTLTGFKFIGDKIHGLEEKGGGSYVFGYEESYGCLIADFARDKDGVQASLMLCEAAAYYKKQGKTLLDVLGDLYREHGFFLDTQGSIFHKGAAGVAKIAALLEGLRREPPREVAGLTVVKTEDYLASEMQREGFPPANVLRYLFDDGSFVAVRPSGTEPKCKYYYCVSAGDRAAAEEKLAGLRAFFEK